MWSRPVRLVVDAQERAHARRGIREKQPVTMYPVEPGDLVTRRLPVKALRVTGNALNPLNSTGQPIPGPMAGIGATYTLAQVCRPCIERCPFRRHDEDEDWEALTICDGG